MSEKAAPIPSTAASAEALLIGATVVGELTDLSVPTIERLTAAGVFPAPRVVPGCRVRRWSRTDIEAWVAALLPARSNAQPG